MATTASASSFAAATTTGLQQQQLRPPRRHVRLGYLSGMLILGALSLTVVQYRYAFERQLHNATTTLLYHQQEITLSALKDGNLLLNQGEGIQRATPPSSTANKKFASNEDADAAISAVHSAATVERNKTTIRKPESGYTPQQEQERLPEYHVVFSTSCSPLQDWQSIVFFYHAMKVGQRGDVTRIASGCSDEEAAALVRFHDEHIRKHMSERFHVHLTPDYSRVRLERGKHPYKYMNKPYGLRHWMENKLGLNVNNSNTSISSWVLDDIVMLMDPDMILLRPLVHNFTDENVLWVDDQTPLTRVVRHGYPMAQQDGYLSNDWMRLNFSHITSRPKGHYAEPPSIEAKDQRQQGPLHWNSGPPYLATVKDMYRIAVRWTEYAPRVLDVFPHIFAEMYGIVIATHQLNLPFTFLKSIVVSTTTSEDREGWPFIDALPDDEVCPSPANSSSNTTSPLPIGLHYCQRYLLGQVRKMR